MNAVPDVSVSVVVPLYCEEESVGELVTRLTTEMERTSLAYEIILVDDGSTDATVARIRAAELVDNRIRGVFLARNYGQTTALQAGFDEAKGEVVVTIDGDLQNDPADIPRLLETLESQGADLVSGWRRDRHDGSVRVVFSRIANRLISKVTGVQLNDYGCTLKAYRRDILDQIRIYGEMHRFLPAVVAEVGAKVVEVEVTHHARKFGSSKYGLDRTVRVVLDLLLIRFLHKYVHRPLHFFGTAGIGAFGLGFLICSWLAFVKIVLGGEIGTRPMLALGVFLMLTGILLVSQGLIGEVSSRLLFEATDRRQYRLKHERRVKIQTGGQGHSGE